MSVRDPSNFPCRECGKLGFELGWVPEARERLLSRGLCHTCDFWLEIIEEKETFFVIERVVYRACPDEPKLRDALGGWGLGFGGRRFEIVRLDGEVVVANNLWCRGPVPERFSERLSDNARWA